MYYYFSNFKLKMRKFISFKPVLFLFAILSILSCKKTDNSTAGGSNDYSTPLFSESTGWKRVGIINSFNQLLGARNWMTPYDLNIVSGNVQVVYDQNNNFSNPSILKASYTLGGSADAKITPLNNLYYFKDNFSNQVSYGTVFFRPETFNVETLIYPYNAGQTVYIKLHDEVGKELTNQISSNFADLSQSTKMYPNGDILAGGLYSNYALEYSYYARTSNTWVRVAESASDTAYHIDYTPFRTDDGSILAFRLFSKIKTKQAFLSISDFIKTANAPYKARFIELHNEYAPTNVIVNQYSPDVIEFASNVNIVNYATEGNSFTVVLREQNNATKNYAISAYKWTKGNTSFQKLYAGVAITKVFGEKLGRSNSIICTIDGKVAALIAEGINGSEQTYSLALFDGSTETHLGAVKNNTYPRAVTTLSCLRYINGSFYAVASPSSFSSDNAEGQHMDIVKLTP